MDTEICFAGCNASVVLIFDDIKREEGHNRLGKPEMKKSRAIVFDIFGDTRLRIIVIAIRQLFKAWVRVTHM